ncbi:MAG: hypothetical protein R3Y05_01290 [bacterium]
MSIFDWNKQLYISKYEQMQSENGYEYEIYSQPKEHYVNYQPLSATFKRQEYGDSVGTIYRAFFDTVKYLNEIHVGDLAYLIDGEIIDIETLVNSELDEDYGSNANYKVKSVLVQNLKIKVDFEKITKDNRDN